MPLHKTPKGREILDAGPAAGLNLQARRILILADGRRSIDEVASMLGGDTLPTVQWLLREGYLAEASQAPAAREQRVAAIPGAAPAGAPVGGRRSLAACKMYMLDMLQLQRTPEAAELRLEIQCVADPGQLVDALLQALRMIVASSSASYAGRVTQRLSEILPEDALPRLAALEAEVRAPGWPLSSVA